jgi:hypothetical protein
MIHVISLFKIKKAVADLKTKKKLLEDRELELRPSETKVRTVYKDLLL